MDSFTKTERELFTALQEIVLQVDVLFEKIDPALINENPELISAQQESRAVLRKFEGRKG